MNWKNVHRDHLPANGQAVLLSLDGVYYLTCYDATKKHFSLKDEPGTFFTSADSTAMYWMEIEEPPQVKDMSDQNASASRIQAPEN